MPVEVTLGITWETWRLFSNVMLVYSYLRLMKVIARVFSKLRKIKSFPMLHCASFDVLVKYLNSSIMNHSILKCDHS